MDTNLYNYVLLARVIGPAITRLDALLVPLAHGWQDSHGEAVRPIPDLDNALRKSIAECEESLAAAKKLLELKETVPARN